jgi:hypothetical protein
MGVLIRHRQVAGSSAPSPDEKVLRLEPHAEP